MNFTALRKTPYLYTGSTYTKVSLISHSTPSKSIKDSGIEDITQLVAFCARVSNPDNQNNTLTASKLISYLIKEKHWSPLEMVNICLEVETTRDIMRQLLRHRSFSFQEFSQRYADPTKEMSFMLREARLQDHTNRQNSVSTQDTKLHAMWRTAQENVIKEALKAYKFAIDNGIAKEQARVVLPEGNTMSRAYVNGTLRSWLHYINLRSSNGTQKEHIEVANMCRREVEKVAQDLLDLTQLED
jgi:thymidylate synthase (FAD)